MKRVPQPDYYVYGCRFLEGKKYLYYWTGKRFSTSIDEAKIFPRFALASEEIWNGPLWDNTEYFKNLGFQKFMPRDVNEKKPEWFDGPEIKTP